MNDVVPKPVRSEELVETFIEGLHIMHALGSDDCDYRRFNEFAIVMLRDLLCDFPEFLCEHHYEFIGIMPAQCIEMRNLVSCAYPRYMHMPDPMNPGPNIDMLPEIQQRPPISPIYVQIVESMPLYRLLDSYLKIGVPLSLFANLASDLLTKDFKRLYIVPFINAIVLYVGTQAIDHIKSKDMTLSVSTISKTWHSEFFPNLFYELDDIGRRLLLTAICNQLTYPNCHTQYFSCLLQYLFETIHGEQARREIVSVILERVHIRPFPWGLAYTAAQLLKIPLFDFYADQYFRSSPVLQSVVLPMTNIHEFLTKTPDMYKVVSDVSKSNATTDEPEKAENVSKSNAATDEPETAENVSKSNATTDEPEKAENVSKSNATTDEPETAEKEAK